MLGERVCGVNRGTRYIGVKYLPVLFLLTNIEDVMGCCEFIMKAILVIINSIVILSGLALLVSGGIYLSKAHEYFEVAELDQYSSDIKPVAIPLMVIGGILLVVGLVGCCGAISGKNGLLNIYIIVVVITVVVEVAVCVYCVVKKDAILEASVEGGEYLVSNVNFGNATDNDITTINSIQYVLSCCGTTGKDSYTTSGFPKSCCNDYTYNTEDGSASELPRLQFIYISSHYILNMPLATAASHIGTRFLISSLAANLTFSLTHTRPTLPRLQFIYISSHYILNMPLATAASHIGTRFLISSLAANLTFSLTHTRPTLPRLQFIYISSHYILNMPLATAASHIGTRFLISSLAANLTFSLTHTRPTLPRLQFIYISSHYILNMPLATAASHIGTRFLISSLAANLTFSLTHTRPTLPRLQFIYISSHYILNMPLATAASHIGTRFLISSLAANLTFSLTHTRPTVQQIESSYLSLSNDTKTISRGIPSRPFIKGPVIPPSAGEFQGFRFTHNHTLPVFCCLSILFTLYIYHMITFTNVLGLVMGCCEFIMKAILVIINSIVILSGLALLVSGGIYLSKAHEYFDVTELDQYSSDIKPVAIPLMVIGGILLVVGLVGCCGAIVGKNGLLNIYLIVVVLTVVVEVAVCVYCVVKKDPILEQVVREEEYLVSNVNFGNATDNDVTTILVIPYVLICCGSTPSNTFLAVAEPRVKTHTLQVASLRVAAVTTTLKLVPDLGILLKVVEQGCTDALTQRYNNIGLVILILIGIIIVDELECVEAACVSKKHDMVA
eukprot:sb/3479667/